MNILLRVAEDLSLSSRSGGSMDSNNLLKRDGSQWKRISLLKIFGGCERKFRDILEGFDMLGAHSGLIKFSPIKFGILIDMVYGPL
jgi:hypothetical protein